ncbi:hypothetical protein [Pseudomonas phage Misse]|nr:hypothetical protein [Pseudomonas phage Misse]
MGFFKKIKKVAAKFDLGHQVGKGLGLPDPSGDALYGSDKKLSPAEAAQKAQADAQKQAAEQAALARQQAEQQAQQMALMQANFQTDLRGENLNTVIAGGTADMASAEADPKKRLKSSGLSTTLGLG